MSISRNIRIGVGLALLLGGCSSFDKEGGLFGEDADCSDYVNMINQSGQPDLFIENAIHPDSDWSEYGGTNGEGGEYHLEAWDCIDDSWWAPVEQQKIVQLTHVVEGCAVSSPEIYLYPCGDQEGIDAPYRDFDQDGVMLIEGDCDDFDPNVGLALLCDQEITEPSDSESSEDNDSEQDTGTDEDE